VAEPSLFGKEELAFLSALNEADVEFMIVGLSAAALQGAPVVTQDVGLWFRNLGDPNIQVALREVGGAYVPPTGSRPPMFVGKGVGLFDIVVHMHGLEGFEEEREKAMVLQIDGIEVAILPLERIIRSKEATGRQKDELVLPVLRDVLTTIREGEESGS
jgi:hypothetical protein